MNMEEDKERLLEYIKHYTGLHVCMYIPAKSKSLRIVESWQLGITERRVECTLFLNIFVLCTTLFGYSKFLTVDELVLDFHIYARGTLHILEFSN